MTFGKRLIESMAYAHFSDHRLAAMMDRLSGKITLQVVKDWMIDKVLPTEEQMERLSVLLRVDRDWLTSGTFTKLVVPAASDKTLFNGLTQEEFERLAVLMREMSGAIQLIGQIQLYGYQHQGAIETKPAGQLLTEQLKQVETAILAVNQHESGEGAGKSVFLSGFTIVNDQRNGYFDVESEHVEGLPKTGAHLVNNLM